MAPFTSAFVLLITVALANLVAQWVPKISKTYFALVAGIIVALIPSLNHLVLEFENETFMIFILAPLLFFEGQVMVGASLVFWGPRLCWPSFRLSLRRWVCTVSLL